MIRLYVFIFNIFLSIFCIIFIMKTPLDLKWLLFITCNVRIALPFHLMKCCYNCSGYVYYFHWSRNQFSFFFSLAFCIQIWLYFSGIRITQNTWYLWISIKLRSLHHRNINNLIGIHNSYTYCSNAHLEHGWHFWHSKRPRGARRHSLNKFNEIRNTARLEDCNKYIS